MDGGISHEIERGQREVGRPCGGDPEPLPRCLTVGVHIGRVTTASRVRKKSVVVMADALGQMTQSISGCAEENAARPENN
jgi:hypothetical protein